MNDKPIDLAQLTQEWVHSHEEDTATTTVYRPAHFRLPPARGRKRFYLQPDGTLTARKPGPTDKSETSAGTWKLEGDQLQLTTQGGSTTILCLEALDAERLVAQKPTTCSHT